ncbi:Uncharacterized protein QJS10_CPA05g02071 [Acorus calamus]|uniref:25S rRNA (uridine-N(3))-methyltransferase BMT5-like domain-containing protein n=1 Tax=Acorus calamus TaxID=4465 RepID=A0AAV9EVD2_ACOCL|nr:Uncharacterized protein QJS10_CPA05g02071 [Acorus calamus]
MEETEKWVKDYASFHEILLVGEGDFSFSLCLAFSFGSATNIVASSLDPLGVKELLAGKFFEGKVDVCYRFHLLNSNYKL